MAATAAPHTDCQFGIRPVEGVTVETDHQVKLTYTVAEARRALGVGQTTIYDLIETKKLKKLKLGRRTLIPAESLRALIASLSEAA